MPTKLDAVTTSVRAQIFESYSALALAKMAQDGATAQWQASRLVAFGEVYTLLTGVTLICWADCAQCGALSLIYATEPNCPECMAPITALKSKPVPPAPPASGWGDLEISDEFLEELLEGWTKHDSELEGQANSE